MGASVVEEARLSPLPAPSPVPGPTAAATWAAARADAPSPVRSQHSVVRWVVRRTAAPLLATRALSYHPSHQAALPTPERDRAVTHEQRHLGQEELVDGCWWGGAAVAVEKLELARWLLGELADRRLQSFGQWVGGWRADK